MAFKRRIECDEEKDPIPSKKAKMLTAIQACLSVKPIVALKKLVIRFLETCCNMVIENQIKQTLLHLASEKGNPQTVKLFVDHHVEFNAKDNSQQKELYKALSNGHANIVELLLSKGADVNKRASPMIGMNREIYSPLGIAIKKGNLPIVKILLMYSANPNIQCRSNDYPLEFALSFGHTEIAKLLLEHGADINQGTFLEQTPLHYFRGQLEIVKFLIEHGANVNQRDELGYTPLHFAAADGYLETLLFLIKHNANINSASNYEGTPLHGAVKNCREQIVDTLLQNGCEVNIKEHRFQLTPLHRSVYYGSLWTFSQLLRYGADVNAKNGAGNTPIHLICDRTRGGTERLKVILRHGHKINFDIRNHDGKTALEIAIHEGCLNKAKMIFHNDL